MPSVLIIEDELPNIQRLQRMLPIVNKEIQVQGILQTVQASVAWLQTQEHPDIIFMDIRLTDGLSFEIFNQVKIQAAVIFITAYDEYALSAFEVNGVDYLLKPLDSGKLERSISKALALKGPDTTESILKLVKHMQTRQTIFRSRFLIAYRDRYLIITTNDIAYFVIEHKMTLLITHDARRFTIDQTLEMLDRELDPQFFFRISRQYIVSLSAIDKISQSFNGQLKVQLNPPVNDELLVSRERSSQLKNWLNQSDL